MSDNGIASQHPGVTSRQKRSVRVQDKKGDGRSADIELPSSRCMFRQRSPVGSSGREGSRDDVLRGERMQRLLGSSKRLVQSQRRSAEIEEKEGQGEGRERGESSERTKVFATFEVEQRRSVLHFDREAGPIYAENPPLPVV